MSGRPALNLYGYLISSARTPSVQALFGERCCLFADSFGEWCSGPKQKHSRRCLLLIRISLRASACSFSNQTISSLCNHSRNLSMSTVTQVSGTRFVETFREKCQFLKMQMCTGGFTSTSELFLPLEAAAAEEIKNTLGRVACLSAIELQQLNEAMLTSPFRSTTRSSLFQAFNVKWSTASTTDGQGRVMLGLQYLTR